MEREILKRAATFFAKDNAWKSRPSPRRRWLSLSQPSAVSWLYLPAATTPPRIAQLRYSRQDEELSAAWPRLTWRAGGATAAYAFMPTSRQPASASGRKRVARLMREKHLAARIRRRDDGLEPQLSDRAEPVGVRLHDGWPRPDVGP